MAKQNFIQGGFKGKLGAVVGQGWKDQLVLRSAGKPSNPRTPKQVAARSAFSLRVLASKLATQSNWNATFFEDPHSGRWGARMATCSKLFGTDKNLLEYVPLIPYGYSPAYPTTSEPEATSNSVTLAWDTEDDLTGRVMSVLIWAKSEADETYSAQLCVAPLAGASGAWTATATLPDGYIFDDDTYVVAVSRSDELFSDKTLYQPPVLVGSPVPTTVFTLSAPAVWGWADGDEEYAFELTPSVALPSIGGITANATARGVLQGDWVTDASTGGGHINQNTVYLYDFQNLDSLGQRPQFVAGSTLTVSPFSFTVDGMRYKFNGATFDLAETPTTQRIYVPDGSFVWSDISALRPVSSLTDWTVTGKGTVGLYTVTSNDGASFERFTVSFVSSAAGLQLKVEEYDFTLYYGTTQSGAPSSDFYAARNGVSYHFSGSDEVTFNPLASSIDTTATHDGVGDGFLDYIGTDHMCLCYMECERLTNVKVDLSDCAPDSTTFTIDGAPVPYTLDKFEYDGTDPIENIQLIFRMVNPPASAPSSCTLSMTWTTDKAKVYTVPNSGGFVITIRIPAQTYTPTINVWT